MSPSERYVQWSADAQPSSTASARPTRDRAGWRAGAARARRRGRRRAPAGTVRRERPVSQKASIQRACGAQRRASRRHEGDVVVGARRTRRERRGRRGTWSRSSARRRWQQARLVVGRQAVARLDLDRRRPGAASLGDEQLGRARRSSSSVAWRVASTVRAMPPAEYGRPPSGRRTPRAVAGEHEVAVAVDEAWHDAPPAASTRRVGRGRRPCRFRHDPPSMTTHAAP